MSPRLRTSSYRLALIAAAACLSLPVMAMAEPAGPAMMPALAPPPTTLSLSATGNVSAMPDNATISFGVVTNGKTAAEAMKANNIRMNAVMAALKSAGIDARDIQTSSLNLNPQYTYPQNQTPVLNGYQAQDQVTVRVNDLNQTGPVIDTVVKAGINQIDSISFGLKNSDGATDQARQAAVATLTQRASLYAAATGLKVKRLLNLEEGSPVSPEPPMAGFAFAKMSAERTTPVAAGDLQLSVTVSATFELEK